LWKFETPKYNVTGMSPVSPHGSSPSFAWSGVTQTISVID
jgi:hypothetical protein